MKKKTRDDIYSGGCSLILLIAIMSVVNVFLLNHGSDRTMYFSSFTVTYVIDHGLYHYFGQESDVYTYFIPLLICFLFLICYLFARKNKKGMLFSLLLYLLDTGVMVWFILKESEPAIWMSDLIIHGAIITIF